MKKPKKTAWISYEHVYGGPHHGDPDVEKWYATSYEDLLRQVITNMFTDGDGTDLSNDEKKEVEKEVKVCLKETLDRGHGVFDVNINIEVPYTFIRLS